jgi:hypothetical protein
LFFVLSATVRRSSIRARYSHPYRRRKNEAIKQTPIKQTPLDKAGISSSRSKALASIVATRQRDAVDRKVKPCCGIGASYQMGIVLRIFGHRGIWVTAPPSFIAADDWRPWQDSNPTPRDQRCAGNGHSAGIRGSAGAPTPEAAKAARRESYDKWTACKLRVIFILVSVAEVSQVPSAKSVEEGRRHPVGRSRSAECRAATATAKKKGDRRRRIPEDQKSSSAGLEPARCSPPQGDVPPFQLKQFATAQRRA